MKKIIILLFVFCLIPQISFAVSFGMYKPNSEYGLWDGFKFNFKDREEGQKIIELKSETQEEKARLEREKNKPEKEIDENEQFRFMREGIVPF